MLASDLENWECWPDYDEEGPTGQYCIGPRECPVAVTCGEATDQTRRILERIPSMVGALESIRDDGENCNCRISRSWYGPGHDLHCPIRIATDALDSL